MQLIDFHPYKLSVITASNKTPQVYASDKDKSVNDSEKEDKSFKDFLAAAESRGK